MPPTVPCPSLPDVLSASCSVIVPGLATFGRLPTRVDAPAGSALFNRGTRTQSTSASTSTRETDMSNVTETSAGATAIRPFRAEIPESEFEALRARIAATRWPEKETVSDQSQGVQLATIQALARYWATAYDFRRVEARLNAWPQFMTEIDGL